MMRFIDTHCHLHFPAYDVDREEVYARLREAGGGAITIGTSLANSREGIAFADTHEGVWATVGLHPSHVTHPHLDENEGAVEERDVDAQALKTLVMSSPKVVAIGEAGLDLYRVEHDQKLQAFEAQARVFKTHLAVAEELGLPVVIHCRDALRELAELLSTRKQGGHHDRCVLHSFTGTWAEAEPLLALGCMLSLNGIITFPPRKGVPDEQQLARVAERVPLDRLLLETDAPYLAPIPHRGARNEPAWTLHVAEYLAKMRNMDVEQILLQTNTNAHNVFERMEM